MKVKDINNFVFVYLKISIFGFQMEFEMESARRSASNESEALALEPKTPQLSQFSLESLPCRLFMGEICVSHS